MKRFYRVLIRTKSRRMEVYYTRNTEKEFISLPDFHSSANYRQELKEHTGCLQIWYQLESDLISGVNDDPLCISLFQDDKTIVILLALKAPVESRNKTLDPSLAPLGLRSG